MDETDAEVFELLNDMVERLERANPGDLLRSPTPALRARPSITQHELDLALLHDAIRTVS